MVVPWICATDNHISWHHYIILFFSWSLTLHASWNLWHHSKCLYQFLAVNPYLGWGYICYHQFIKKSKIAVDHFYCINWSNFRPATSNFFLVVKVLDWLSQVNFLFLGFSLYLPLCELLQGSVLILYQPVFGIFFLFHTFALLLIKSLVLILY